MEQLASGLWGLVGKAGRGVGTLARQVEAVTKEAASGVAQEFQETLEVPPPPSSVPIVSTTPGRSWPWPLPNHLS